MRARRVVIGLAVAISVPTVAWWSGWPQRIAVEQSVRSFLKAEADARGVLFAPNFGAERLTIYPDAAARQAGRAFAELEGLRVEYRLRPENGRNLPSVVIETLRLFPDASNPDRTNFKFLTDFLFAEQADTGVGFVPERLEIGAIEFAGAWKEARGKLGPLRLEVNVRDLDDLDLSLDSAALTGAATGRLDDLALESVGFEAGHLEFDAVVSGKQTTLRWLHEVPGYHRTEGSATLESIEGGSIIELQDATLSLNGDDFLPIINQFTGSFTLAYDTVDITVPQVHWDTRVSGPPTGAIAGTIQGMTITDRISTLYEGGVEWKGSIVGGEMVSSDFMLTLSQGLGLHAVYAQGDTRDELTTTCASWDKSAILDALPKDLITGIEDLPFEKLDGTTTFSWNDTEFTLGSKVMSVSKEKVQPIDVDINLTGVFDRIAETTGEINARVGTGTVRAKGALDADDLYVGRVEFDRVQLRPLVLLATGNRLPEDITGFVDGAMRAEHPSGSPDMRFSPRLKFSELTVGETILATLVLGAEIALNSDSREGSITDLILAADDDSLRIQLDQADLNMDSGDVHGAIQYSANLDLLGRLGGVEGFYGMVEGGTSLDIEDGRYTMNLTFDSPDLGYNDFAMPYGTNFFGTGTISLSDADGVWTAENIVAKAGEGTTFFVSEARMDEAGVSAKTIVESDMLIGIEMGYYSGVEGQLTGRADWLLPSDGDMSVDWSLESRVEALVLNDNAGTVGDMTLAATGDYLNEVRGSGSLTIGNITAAGATISAFAGEVTLANDILVIPEGRATVFEGGLVSRIEMKVLEEGMPLTYTGHLEKIDLARLTQEVKPPKTNLTGIADGVLTAKYSLDKGLSDFELTATSDTNFTINRSLVEEMMQMQNVLGGLAEKKAEKTIAKFLGDASQRPFQTASMNIYLLNDVIQGVTEMRSEKTKDYNGLNLTIQLNIDKPALVSSLQMLEESNISDVSF